MAGVVLVTLVTAGGLWAQESIVDAVANGCKTEKEALKEVGLKN